MKRCRQSKNEIIRLIYKDCISVLPASFLFCTMGGIFGGVLTVYAAEILGEFADSVFRMDVPFGMTNLWKLLAVLGASLLIVPLIEMLGELFLFKAALKHERLIWGRLMDKSYENLMQVDEGEILARLDGDPCDFRVYFMMCWSNGVIAFITGTYLLYTSMSVSILLALVVIGASLLKLIIPLLVRKQQAKYDELDRKYTAEVRRLEGEMTKSIHSVKLLGMGNKLADRVDRLYREYFKNNFSGSVKSHVRADHILSFLDTFCVLLILYVGAIQVSKGLVTAGMIAAMLGYYSSYNRVISCVDYVVRKIPIVRNLESRMHIFYDGMENEECSVLEEVLSIKTENLSYSYEDGKVICWDDFRLKKGEKIVFRGANGSGKSTLLKLMCGLLKEYEGGVYLNGKEMREVSIGSWRKQFAFVEQDPYLFEGTVFENVHIGNPQADEVHVQEVFEKLGLIELADRRISLEQNELSGGEKQKIAIARAILRNASFLILDEPSNYLDCDSAQWLNDFLANTDKTVICVSHENGVITSADQVMIRTNTVY